MKQIKKLSPSLKKYLQSEGVQEMYFHDGSIVVLRAENKTEMQKEKAFPYKIIRKKTL